MKAHVSDNNFIWVKSQSGNLYVCKVGSIDPSTASEEELRKHCVDESQRPDNS